MSRLFFSPCSIISTSMRLTPKTVTLATLPSISATLASENCFHKSADGEPRISAIVGSPPKDWAWNLKASSITYGSAEQVNRRTRVVASLQEFQGICLSIKGNTKPRSTTVSPSNTALWRVPNTLRHNSRSLIKESLYCLIQFFKGHKWESQTPVSKYGRFIHARRPPDFLQNAVNFSWCRWYGSTELKDIIHQMARRRQCWHIWSSSVGRQSS